MVSNRSVIVSKKSRT